jgi:hypothetical protein
LRGPVLDGSSNDVSAAEKCRDGRIGALFDCLEFSDVRKAAAGGMAEVVTGRRVRRAMAAAARIDRFRVRIDMVVLIMFVPLFLFLSSSFAFTLKS